jgi:senataxin
VLEKDRFNESVKAEIKELEAKLVGLTNKSSIRKRIKEVEKRLLRQTDVILATLNSSGSERLDLIRDHISIIIVDEAAQATEPSIIIPLQTGSIKLILIGDPRQLPAMVLSSDADITLLNRSLF